MKNYDRYKDVTPNSYNKKTPVSILVGNKNKEIIGNILNKIKNKRVLELGCGTGKYTEIYYKNNDVKCIDINPHLFKLSDIPIIKGNVVKLDSLLSKKKKFDYILSFFMTEYLNEYELARTMDLCKGYLSNNGKIVFTFISRGVLGHLYIIGSRFLAKTKKYNYDLRTIKKISNNAKLEIEHISSIKRFGLEFAKVIIFRER